MGPSLGFGGVLRMLHVAVAFCCGCELRKLSFCNIGPKTIHQKMSNAAPTTAKTADMPAPSAPPSHHTAIIPTGVVPASAYRTLEETLHLLTVFNVNQIKMVVMREDGTYMESVMEARDFSPALLQGFQVGEQWVYPDPEKAFFNPFFKHGAVLSIPCFRKEQFLQFQQQQQQHAVMKAAHPQPQPQVSKAESQGMEGARVSVSSAPVAEGEMTRATSIEEDEAAIAELMVMNSQGIFNQGNDKKRQGSPMEGDHQYMGMQPMRKLPKKGTSCHQCKNTKHLQQLAFCTNAIERSGKIEKRSRSCRKKFCKVCLCK
jgi:hypothetical protein